MHFNMKNTAVYGLEKSIIASGNPMRTVMQNNAEIPTARDEKRAASLGNTEIGEGHDQFLTGIIVQFDINAPLCMWKEIQRYHFLDFISSQSTMHCIAKFKIEERCTNRVYPETIARLQKDIDIYNSLEVKDKELWRTIIDNIPSGFHLGATMTTNYRQLKTIYNQRRHHRLEEWDEFCDWCESLPLFKELCLQKYFEE